MAESDRAALKALLGLRCGAKRSGGAGVRLQGQQVGPRPLEDLQPAGKGESDSAKAFHHAARACELPSADGGASGHKGEGK